MLTVPSKADNPSQPHTSLTHGIQTGKKKKKVELMKRNGMICGAVSNHGK